MKRAEAIKQIESLFEHCEAMMTSDEPVWSQDCEALKVALSALRGPTREQVERVWRGEWILHKSDDVFSSYYTCSNCGCKYGESSGVYIFDLNFCPHCGVIMKAEAVDMVMERMKELK